MNNNEFYLNAKVSIEGDLMLSQLPEIYRTAPRFFDNGLSIRYESDVYQEGISDSCVPSFNIDFSSRTLEFYRSYVKNGELTIWQQGRGVGELSLYNSEAALHMGCYSRNIEYYLMKFKRNQENRTTSLSISGMAGHLKNLHTLSGINHLNFDDQMEKIIQLGNLKFSIEFNIPDERISEIFYDEKIRAIYTKLIQNPNFIGKETL